PKAMSLRMNLPEAREPVQGWFQKILTYTPAPKAQTRSISLQGGGIIREIQITTTGEKAGLRRFSVPQMMERAKGASLPALVSGTTDTPRRSLTSAPAPIHPTR